jgi:predicted MFS family arabinose efflux permease
VGSGRDHLTEVLEAFVSTAKGRGTKEPADMPPEPPSNLPPVRKAALATCSTRLDVPGKPEQRSTRLIFLIAGLAGAVWAALIPFAKARAALDPGELGLVLLSLGAGSIIGMPLAGAAASRHGCRLVVLVSTLLVCFALPILAVASNPLILAAVLFVFGAGVGSVDCAVNIQAIIVERASGRAMMSGFHGLFSLGGILGAGGVSAILILGATPFVASLWGSAVVLACLAWAVPHLLGYGGESEGPLFALPHGIILFIGVLCFIVFLTEGAALDWSGVFLTSVRGIDPAYAGIGYASFAAAMTIGRLTGDQVVRRIGGVQVTIFGALCAAAGLTITILVPAWQAGLFGYALVGAGLSNIVPVLYSAAGRQSSMPEHTAVPAITTLGYAGILCGPAGIGFVAHLSSLPTAFALMALLLLSVAVSARVLRKLV